MELISLTKILIMHNQWVNCRKYPLCFFFYLQIQSIRMPTQKKNSINDTNLFTFSLRFCFRWQNISYIEMKLKYPFITILAYLGSPIQIHCRQDLKAMQTIDVQTFLYEYIIDNWYHPSPSLVWLLVHHNNISYFIFYLGCAIHCKRDGMLNLNEKESLSGTNEKMRFCCWNFRAVGTKIA